MIYDSLADANNRIMPKVDGVMIGIVTNNKDPENLGRLKVKIPVISSERESDWIRMAMPFAGKDRGTLFLPEVNDEVLLAFHMGDLSQPIVVGCLWNDKNLPPSGKDEQNNVRKLVSRSGHSLTFNDKSGDESVSLVTKKGLKLEILDKSDTIKLQDSAGSHTITIKGGSAGEVEVKSGGTKITINAKGEATIESAGKLTLKSTKVDIEAKAQMTLKAGAMLDLKSDGMINIKGSIVKIN
ncbi:MAG: hypothetical protein K0R75_2673 [Paenibacillaceae bacterium]|jgi:uncharacterized protein involved in type VI secretion and phage assembly|nr:hypothetical protein [Paenibacillaceae bacterium]